MGSNGGRWSLKTNISISSLYGGCKAGFMLPQHYCSERVQVFRGIQKICGGGGGFEQWEFTFVFKMFLGGCLLMCHSCFW